MCETENKRLIKRREYLDSEIDSLMKYKPEIVFKTPDMIYFREVEDLIAHILQTKYRTFKLPAWRFYCREDGRTSISHPQNRLYYMIEASMEDPFVLPRENVRYIKLVTGDATDYSGHGSGDMELMEYFLEKCGFNVEERPLSYLLDYIEYELYKLTIEKGNKAYADK